MPDLTQTHPADPGAARLGVLLSGSGRTLVNLLASIKRGELHAQVALVIASRNCLGAQRARDAGLATLILPGVIPAIELERTLREHTIDLVACAGYLKYLNVPPSFAGRIVNIHPSLLPKFGGTGMYGDRVHTAVLAAGETESGCTVHYVDDQFDHGAIIAQGRCPVLPGDDPHTLAARVFEVECQTYPRALQQLIARGVST